MVGEDMMADAEQRCIERVRKQFDLRNCYALSRSDSEYIENCLKEVAPNPDNSLFPDFLFTGGFIEHFQVSSAYENRKGSTHIKEKAEFDRAFNEKSDRLMAETGNNNGEVKSINETYQYKGHSYNNLELSFKRHWASHIRSLEKSPQFKGQIGIFMVQYSDMALEMMESIYDSSAEGLMLNIREAQRFSDYKLSRDKNLLNYINSFKGTIKYVIFVNSTETEIVSVDNIEAILKQLPWDFCIAGKLVLERRAVYASSIALAGDE